MQQELIISLKRNLKVFKFRRNSNSTGFQGINNNRITTLGRGGTDVSAIMIGKIF